MAGALNYYKKGTYAQPITLTEFVLSPGTPAKIGGIVIETALDGYGDDGNKYLNYVIVICKNIKKSTIFKGAIDKPIKQKYLYNYQFSKLKKFINIFIN